MMREEVDGNQLLYRGVLDNSTARSYIITTPQGQVYQRDRQHLRMAGSMTMALMMTGWMIYCM